MRVLKDWFNKILVKNEKQDKAIYSKLVKRIPLKSRELKRYNFILKSQIQEKSINEILDPKNADCYKTLIKQAPPPINGKRNDNKNFWGLLLNALMKAEFYFSTKQRRIVSNSYTQYKKENLSIHDKQFLLSLSRCLPYALKSWIESKHCLYFPGFHDLIARIKAELKRRLKQLIKREKPKKINEIFFTLKSSEIDSGKEERGPPGKKIINLNEISKWLGPLINIL